MAEVLSLAYLSVDYYKFIGLDQNASRDQIEIRINFLATELTKIESVLLDEVHRSKYDQELARRCRLNAIALRGVGSYTSTHTGEKYPQARTQNNDTHTSPVQRRQESKAAPNVTPTRNSPTQRNHNSNRGGTTQNQVGGSPSATQPIIGGGRSVSTAIVIPDDENSPQPLSRREPISTPTRPPRGSNLTSRPITGDGRSVQRAIVVPDDDNSPPVGRREPTTTPTRPAHAIPTPLAKTTTLREQHTRYQVPISPTTEVHYYNRPSLWRQGLTSVEATPRRRIESLREQQRDEDQRGGHQDESKREHCYITGCSEQYVGTCRSPGEIINTRIARDLPVRPNSGGVKTGYEKINGVYVIRNKSTKELYIGQSMDVFRRIAEHQSSIRNGTETVGGFIHSISEMEFCVFEFPDSFTKEDREYYEQHLINNARAEYGAGMIKNRKNAMSERRFQQHRQETAIIIPNNNDSPPVGRREPTTTPTRPSHAIPTPLVNTTTFREQHMGYQELPLISPTTGVHYYNHPSLWRQGLTSVEPTARRRIESLREQQRDEDQRGGHQDESEQECGYITGCSGRYAGTCRSPGEIINIRIARDLPVFPNSGGVITGYENINGVYVIRNKSTKELYIGQSMDVFRRIGEHQSSICYGKDTVGDFIHSISEMEFCVFEFPDSFTKEDREYYEQHLINNARTEYGAGMIMNRRNAMSERRFQDYRQKLRTVM